ncbi:MAG: hypothetical protein Q7S44_02285 [bacterium]|nr:hypothetical protein [bacterium]
MKESLGLFNPFLTLPSTELRIPVFSPLTFFFTHPLTSMLEKFNPSCPKCGIKMYHGLGGVWSCYCSQKEKLGSFLSVGLTPLAV